jgi:hypothetical protein
LKGFAKELISSCEKWSTFKPCQFEGFLSISTLNLGRTKSPLTFYVNETQPFQTDEDFRLKNHGGDPIG